MTSIVRRVPTRGPSGGSSATFGGNVWGNCWGFLLAQPGRNWGRTWLYPNAGSAASDAKPEENNTARVPGSPAATNTVRVASHAETAYDAWGGSMGHAWARAWHKRIASSVLGHTKRVPQVAAPEIT